MADSTPIVLIVVAGLGFDDLTTHGDRQVRPLQSGDPPVAGAFAATVLTGLPAHRHGVGHDQRWDPTLHAARPWAWRDLAAAPLWADVPGAVAFGPGASAEFPVAANELDTAVLTDVLGAGFVARMSGDIASQRRCMGAVDELADLLSRHAATTAALEQTLPPLTVAVHDLGPMLRAGAEPAALGRFLALMVRRLRELAAGNAGVVVVGRRSAPADTLLEQDVEAGRGFVLWRDIELGDGPARIVDVAPTVRAALGLAPWVDGPGQASISSPPPTARPTWQHDAPDHPEAASIAVLRESGLREPVVALDGARRQRLADEANAVLATSAAADGDHERAGRFISAVRGARSLRVLTVAAWSAFEAGDMDTLRARLAELRVAGYDTPLMRAADVLTDEPPALPADATGYAFARAADLAGLPEAAALYERCIADADHPVDAGAHLARLRSQAGDHDSAIEHALNVVEARPQHAAAHALLARILHHADDNTSARTAFEQALIWQPRADNIRRDLAKLLRLMGDHASAARQESMITSA